MARQLQWLNISIAEPVPDFILLIFIEIFVFQERKQAI